MVQNIKVLEVFFDEPTALHYFREIVRKAGVSPNFCQKQLRKLTKAKLIVHGGKRGSMIFYKANREKEEFIRLKRISNLNRLEMSGIVDFLVKHFSPNALVLFGSYEGGFDIESSDVDIFVIVEKVLDINEKLLKRFESVLLRKVQLHVADFGKLSKELRNNIVNGHVLYGYLKVF